MKKALSIAAVLGFVSGVLLAVEVGGVKLPDTVSADGKTLKFNGAGIRKKAIFKVYVAALYVETPSKDHQLLTKGAPEAVFPRCTSFSA